MQNHSDQHRLLYITCYSKSMRQPRTADPNDAVCLKFWVQDRGEAESGFLTGVHALEQM